MALASLSSGWATPADTCTSSRRAALLRVLCRLYPSVLRLAINYYMRAYIGILADLIRHGLHALRETLQQDEELTPNNTAIGIVGPSGVRDDAGITVDFRILEGSPIEMCRSPHHAAKRSTGASRFCFLLRSVRFGVGACTASFRQWRRRRADVSIRRKTLVSWFKTEAQGVS